MKFSKEFIEKIIVVFGLSRPKPDDVAKNKFYLKWARKLDFLIINSIDFIFFELNDMLLT